MRGISADRLRWNTQRIAWSAQIDGNGGSKGNRNQQSRFKKRPKAADHWHRTGTDEGRPYEFKDAETLISDFFDEVERVLKERDIPFEAVEDKEGDRP